MLVGPDLPAARVVEPSPQQWALRAIAILLFAATTQTATTWPFAPRHGRSRTLSQARLGVSVGGAMLTPSIPLTVTKGGPMPGERSESDLTSVGFDSAWCATDLGEYRTCRYTYEYYPYESLPPLDSTQFTGAFQWLGGTGEPVPEQVTELDRLAEDLAARNLTLPRDFVTFQADSKLRHSLDEVSVTSCWTDISEPLPSPVEPGAFLVRFLRDQQDCVIWYLYLRPSGEVFVVSSYLDYEYAYEAQRAGDETETNLDDPEEQQAAILWCAPSFEEFTHRFWIENRLWHALHGNDQSGLEPQLRDYLRHYTPEGMPA
ncbi:hypothetical protein [Streptomyces sp. NPDC002685]|uniref:hypothetical protein n=1 Tax=Streptomyces sp. NPDC002685 TaxID=3154540 RepID=UPI00331F6125